MAKPNENQKEVLSYLKNQISYWNNTNDINSSTHQGDMEEEFIHIEDFFDNESKDKLLHSLNEIYTLVKNVK